MRWSDQVQLVTEYFSYLGMTVVYSVKNQSENGPDMFVRKGKGRPLSVEIKLARKNKKTTAVTDSVSSHRVHDDLIAIIISSDYVLIQPMKEHLLLVGPKGTRPFTWAR